MHSLSRSELCARLDGFESVRVDRALAALRDEGLIALAHDGSVRLPD
jgi:hypothetical protein